MSTRPSQLAGPPAPSPRVATLVDALIANADDDRPFVVLHGSGEPRPMDARATLGSARRWATALRTRGVGPGHPVAIMLPTSADFLGAFFGALLLGALPMPLATPMTFGPLDRYLEQCARAIRHARARILVATPRIVEAARLTSLEGTIDASLTPAEADETLPRATRDGAIDARTPALLQYTSGTTGTPRGVLLGHRAIVANASAIAHALAIVPTDVGVSWLPLHHDMGLIGALLTALVAPYTLHLMAPEAFIMRPRRWLELIAQHRGTLSTAPNFAYELVAKKADPEGLDLSSWRAALDGAEPVHGATLRRFAERFRSTGFRPTALTPVYGLAESSLAVTTHPLGEPAQTTSVDRASLERGALARASADPSARELVSCGSPVAGTSVTIRDVGSRVLPEGAIGEIRVSGPSVMDGYYHDEEASATALEDGALRTGDLGFVRGGRLFISGRARELIIQSGRNVHPEDVERVALESDTSVASAAAFARGSAATGTEDLVVVVEARGLDAEAKDRVSTRIRGELLAVMGVRADAVAVWPIGTIPRTSSGKVRRAECAERFASGGPR